MTNPHRALIAVKLGDAEHDLCLTNGALAEIEAELSGWYGRPFNSIDLLGTGDRTLKIGVREATAIIHAGLKGAGGPLKAISRASLAAHLNDVPAAELIRVAYKAVNAAFTDPDANPPQEGASPSDKSAGAN